jgi:hypothetical protein
MIHLTDEFGVEDVEVHPMASGGSSLGCSLPGPGHIDYLCAGWLISIAAARLRSLYRVLVFHMRQ